MMKKRLTILGSLCLLIIAGILLSATRAPRHQQTMPTIRIGILQVPNDVTAARQTKALEQAARKQGYRVKYYAFDSGVDANKALMANSVDMATMGDTNAVVAMAAKIPVNLVWVNDVVGSNEQLVVKQTAQIKRPADLKGKTIATPFASTSHYSLMMYLKANHLLGKVRLMDMQTTEIVAAWRRGDIDGAYTWEPSLSRLPGRKCLMSSEQLEKQGYLTANVTLATTQFQQRHPEALKLVLRTLGQVHDQYQQHPEAIAQQTGKALDISTQQAITQIGSSRWVPAAKMGHFMNGTFCQNFDTTCQFMASQQLLNSKPSLQDCQHFIDTSYAMPRTEE